MFILDSPSTDPYFNIAAEEYLLKATEGDFVFVYVNEPSIIIGKHQNAYAEISLPYVMENNIPVVRRISGGGTVWHDQGNVNFSLILNGQEGKLVDFRQYATPVLTFLQGLRIPAEFGRRNEILVAGRKISGNAEHVYRQRVLHHGTLLFSSDLRSLQAALEKGPGKYSDRGVQSVPSPVVNIRDFLSTGLPVATFRNELLDHFSGSFKDSEKYLMSGTDMEGISGLVGRKYSTWKWNFGYSPRYRLARDAHWEGRRIRVQLEVEKGRILEISISSDDADRQILDRLSRRLSGVEHEPGKIREKIRQSGLVNPGLMDTFIRAFF